MTSRTRRSTRTILRVCALAAAFAACSSSSPNPAPITSTSTTTTTSTTALATTTSAAPTTRNTFTGKGNFNSCDVVTQADAASALGEPVTPGVEGTATSKGGLACVFYGPAVPAGTDPSSEQPDSVRVAVFEGPEAAVDYNEFKPADAQSISGYGDEAYFDGSWFSVLKGDFYLRISVRPASGSPSPSAEMQLAKAILPKL